MAYVVEPTSRQFTCDWMIIYTLHVDVSTWLQFVPTQQLQAIPSHQLFFVSEKSAGLYDNNYYYH